MDEKKKAELIAAAENVEALRDFFVEWWTAEQLYETAAKATVVLMHICQKMQLCSDDKEELMRLMNQHLMMIEHMKPFASHDDGE